MIGVLFWVLFIVSIFTFIYALINRSWTWMLFSGVTALPIAWYFSGYPSFSVVLLVPLIHLILAILFYLKSKKK